MPVFKQTLQDGARPRRARAGRGDDGAATELEGRLLGPEGTGTTGLLGYGVFRSASVLQNDLTEALERSSGVHPQNHGHDEVCCGDQTG